MKILLVDNAHIYRTPDGRLFSPGVYDSTFFRRYLEVFDSVEFLAKTRHIDGPDDMMLPIEVDRLHVVELPWYRGIRQMIGVLPALLRAYRNAGKGCEATIFRVCQLESFMCYLLRRARSPFYVEVVNDPATFVSIPVLWRRINIGLLRWMLWRARGAAFVTEHTLQDQYLPVRRARSPEYLRSHYSTIELRAEHFGVTKTFAPPLATLRIVHVANWIVDDVKGHVCVIRAAALLAARGRSVAVTFIGSGPFVQHLQGLVATLPALEGRVDFAGRINDRRVLLARLREADIFVLPTRFEGLPRSLIEAMAAGLPALSTPTAGVPELLRSEYLFDPDDAQGIAGKLAALMDDPEQLTAMSAENLATARRYENIELDARRRVFYSRVRDAVMRLRRPASA